MSERARIALFALAVALLAGAGLFFSSRGDPESAQPVDARSRALSVPAGAAAAEELEARGQVLSQLERSQREAKVDAAAELDPTKGEHTGPKPADLERLERIEAEAEPVARRFFAAFSRYELGELDRRIERELRATSTADFADELIGVPPRLPAGAELPARGELSERLDFVAGESDPARREVLAAELVSYVDRDGERSPIAIEMTLERGRWLVAGIGR